MEKTLETIKNLNLNIDSNTALKISLEWIHYRYFETVCECFIITMIFIFIGYAIRKSMQD